MKTIASLFFLSRNPFSFKQNISPFLSWGEQWGKLLLTWEKGEEESLFKNRGDSNPEKP